eukprot:TRINITY_DN26133_c0_g1_i1.p1 TRINITY_DN26133_c0_g1~~TRINITY_DN26133_c0_g1_i1.p1  ORF type:complete len:308 (+),score=83.02 TRINITY_DN26133_c0_g1_i1:96-926(+)
MAAGRVAVLRSHLGRGGEGAAPRAAPAAAAGRMQGQRAVVTGGGSGLGRGIALAFAREGATVIITGRREEALQETQRRARGLPGGVLPLRCDISSYANAERLAAFAADKLGGVDVLVNNAGTNVPRRKLKDISVEDWHTVVGTNLNGTFHVCRAVLPLMREQRRGTVINITSIAGKRASVLAGGSYVASKFGMNGLGNVINLEEWENGIRCTNICPGEAATEILDRRPQPPPAERRAMMAQPEDVGEIAVLVATLHPRVFIPELTVTGSTTIDLAM